ncbi:hypothetical protein [Caenimonas sp. SL110]|uniref:hypothetical protein n=1 Tax=Caenimonas sp. SL110 TaxID=1450524 RepID=UPI00069FD847|nr:hypothetical protein [Caenimonas sp. SL110]
MQVLLEAGGFALRFMRNPRQTGAVAPASKSLARVVGEVTRNTCAALEAERGEGLALIELGAGTGALTGGIAALRPVLVEADAVWASNLRRRFPSLEVRAECACDTLESLRGPVGIVTSIPLLNNPQGIEIKRLIARGYTAGLIRFCVLYTYGWGDPLRDAGFRQGRRERFVAMSLPPASVWVYR